MTRLRYRLPDADAAVLAAELRARGHDVREEQKRLGSKGQTLAIEVEDAALQHVRGLVRDLAPNVEAVA